MKWMVRVLTPFGVIELLHEEIWGLRFYVCLGWGCHQSDGGNGGEKFHGFHPMD